MVESHNSNRMNEVPHTCATAAMMMVMGDGNDDFQRHNAWRILTNMFRFTLSLFLFSSLFFFGKNKESILYKKKSKENKILLALHMQGAFLVKQTKKKNIYNFLSAKESKTTRVFVWRYEHDAKREINKKWNLHANTWT